MSEEMMSPAQLRMHIREFDPMYKMIDHYERLLSEDAYLKAMRSDVEPVDDDGKPMRRIKYSSVSHMSLLSAITQLGMMLMRYAYEEAPRSAPKVPSIPPMQVTLEGSIDREE